MTSITKLYPLLKDIGLDDKKSQKFIEIIEDSYRSKIEQETKSLVTNDIFLTEISKIRKEISLIREELTKETTSIRQEISLIRIEMASMKVELIKWNVGTIIAVAGVVTAIVKLIG
ncbi:MAG: hypothetical protein ACE5HI_09055 [bacterium]